MGYAFQSMVGSDLGPKNSLNKELKCVLGSTPGMRGERGPSSWAFHIAGPCDPWCDRLVHCWGATLGTRGKDLWKFWEPVSAGHGWKPVESVP